MAPYESFKRREWLELDEIRKREFFLFLSIEWIWWIFEIFNNFNFTDFVISDHWNFGFSTQQMDFTIFHNLSNSTKCYETTWDNLYAQAWIFSVDLTLTITWSLKIPYREQRELMEELNRPPEFNLSIFDAANLKLFESESKNEIFYEIIPFIVQSRKSWKIVIFVIAEKVVTIFTSQFSSLFYNPESRSILITFFGLSCLLLVLSLVFTSLEWRKLSITISVFNFVLLSGYICLFLGLSSTTFDVFEPLFAFRLQHHNYQRKG